MQNNCNGVSCGMCHFSGSDLQIHPCGCTLHSRCVPVQVLISPNNGAVTSLSPQEQLIPRNSNEVACPVCNSVTVTGIKFFPMDIHLLDQAVDIKKRAIAKKKGGGSNPTDSNTTNNNTLDEVQAESSYLLLSHSSNSGSNGLASNNDFQRTGRWTDDEIEYVDFLMQAFDRGNLPLPSGVRLNDFLCQILLCKASRLTKKMKNARLSIRSYEINTLPNVYKLDYELLSTLQEKFLSSISNEVNCLELRFNIEKVWRTNLSNLCVQAGYTLLDASAWITSLEDMEKRATQAEENIRKARRFRMGLALKTDVKNNSKGVFFSGIPVQRPRNTTTKTRTESISSTGTSNKKRKESGDFGNDQNSDSNTVSSSETGDRNYISQMLDHSDNHDQHRKSDSIDDFTTMLNELVEGTPVGDFEDGDYFPNQSVHPTRTTGGSGGSFLEEVVHYMEINQLPFEHVDVWVPSYKAQSEGQLEDLRLHHAGHATRNELDHITYNQLHEYGEYSTRFSFAPGVGLPGRVYKYGQPRWECRICDADPKIFERAGGAKVYGVYTGIGIPVSSSFIGRIVVAMYSLTDMKEDTDMLRKITNDLSAFCPKPKWKLVVEMGDSTQDDSHRNQQQASPSAVKSQDPLMQKLTPSEITLPSQQRSSGNIMQRTSSISSYYSQESTKSQQQQYNDRDEDMRIATLLGDHMPGAELLTTHQEPATPAPNLLLPDFMSLRLLLLRSPESRSVDDNGLLDVIRKSYRCFSKDNRSPREVAELLVKDWRFMRNNTSQQQTQDATRKSTAPTLNLTSYNHNNNSINNIIAQQQQHHNIHHQSHVMMPSSATSSSTTTATAAATNTFVGTGQPAKVPYTLGHPKNSSNSLTDLCTNNNNKKRRLSHSDHHHNQPSASSYSVKIIEDENET